MNMIHSVPSYSKYRIQQTSQKVNCSSSCFNIFQLYIIVWLYEGCDSCPNCEAMAMLSPSAPGQATDRWGSWNGGTPKWVVYNGKSYQNGWFRGNLNIGKPLKWMIWGYPYFRTPPYWPAFQRCNPSVWRIRQIPAVPLVVTTIISSAKQLQILIEESAGDMRWWNPPATEILPPSASPSPASSSPSSSSSSSSFFLTMSSTLTRPLHLAPWWSAHWSP